jgi:hypothetical protein
MSIPREVKKDFLWMMGIGIAVLGGALLYAKTALASASKTIQLVNGGPLLSTVVAPGQIAQVVLPSGGTWISLTIGPAVLTPQAIAGGTGPVGVSVATGQTAVGLAVWSFAGTTQQQPLSIACVQS